MKLFKTLCLTFAAVLFGGTMLYAQPKCEIVGGNTYDWGTVNPSDTPLKCKIVVKNSGTDTLVITEVKPGCSCTAAPISKKLIAPNDTASLDITLNLNGHNTNVVKTLAIASNDPTTNLQIVYLKANVFYPLEITPTQYFVFNEMFVGIKKDAKLSFKNLTKESITLYDFEAPATVQLNVMGKKILAPGEQLELVATANPNKSGYFGGTIKFKTNNEHMKEVALQCYGSVKDSMINSDSDTPTNNSSIPATTAPTKTQTKK